MCSDDTILPGHLNDRFQAASVASARASTPDVSGAAEFLRASELFQEQSSSSNTLEELGAPELDRLLHALHGIETAVISAMRTKGCTPAAQQGLRETEGNTIKKALNLHQWNITEAARSLGIGRNTLYRKIKQFNLAR